MKAAVIVVALLCRNENAAQRGSFRAGYPADILGSFARDIPAQNFGQGPPNRGKASIWARTSMTRRRGRPRLQGICKNFGQNNFGLNFRFLFLVFLFPRDPDILKTVRAVNLLSVVNLLRVLFLTAENVVNHYIFSSDLLSFSSESLCLVNSLQSSKTPRNRTPYYFYYGRALWVTLLQCT